MLAFMRKFAKSWLALVLFIPLMLGFAVFGVNSDILGGGSANYVIKAGNRTVTSFDFKREYAKLSMQNQKINFSSWNLVFVDLFCCCS